MQLLLIHRGDRIRTYGIRLPKTALYQAELRPGGRPHPSRETQPSTPLKRPDGLLASALLLDLALNNAAIGVGSTGQPAGLQEVSEYERSPHQMQPSHLKQIEFNFKVAK